MDGGRGGRRRLGLGARRRAGRGVRLAGGVRRQRAAVRVRRAARPRVLPESHGAPRSLDVAGTVAVTAALALLVLGLTQSPAYCRRGRRVRRVRSDRAPRPPIRSSPDRRPGFVRANAVALALTATTTPAMFLAILYQQEALGRSALAAGLWCAPFNLAVIAGSRWTARRPVAIAAGAAALARSRPSPSSWPSCSWARGSAARPSPRRRRARQRCPTTSRASPRACSTRPRRSGPRRRRRWCRSATRRASVAAAVAARSRPATGSRANVPPSTDQAAPVTSEARSEHRKTTTAAISSGSREAARAGRGRLRLERLLARPRPWAAAVWSPSPPSADPQRRARRRRARPS